METFFASIPILAFHTSIPDTVNSFRHGMLKVLIPVLFINNL